MYYDKDELLDMKKRAENRDDQYERGKKFVSKEVEVHCVHCKHERFELEKSLLNTRWLSFFNLDWLNNSANILICKKCGFIHWFANEVIENND